jgi:hypothetical protein
MKIQIIHIYISLIKIDTINIILLNFKKPHKI